MQTTLFEKYLTDVKSLVEQKRSDPSSLQHLLHLIEETKEQYQEESDFEAFFSGEYAFYSESYERALQYYLKAKKVPRFEFYCYRASAYAAKENGLIDKAKFFADRAKKIFPEDFAVQEILAEIDKGPSKDTEEKQKKANPAPALGVKEIEELSYYFNPSTPLEPRVEQSMNSDASVFSFPKSDDPATTAVLTQRLYPLPQAEPVFSALIDQSLKKNAQTQDQGLEASFHSFQKSQADLIASYLRQSKQRVSLPDYCLYILQGWNFKSEMENKGAIVPFLLAENLRKTSGGYFLRWNRKGIAVNPGKNFLENFHRAGLHLKDIDYVIVTQDHPDAYADIKQIYNLNYHLNRVSGNDLQVIHYYLNQKTHQELAHQLKPNFKQEKNTVHNLELFLDSPEIEKVDLGNGIILNYFPVLTGTDNGLHALGIRLELKSNQELQRGSISLGYIAGTPWTPLISHHLGSCDILIAGLGNINPNDYARVSYNHDSLGYNGAFSLLEEVIPQLMLCSEFDGRDGDMRLEIVKKMRADYTQSHFKTEGRTSTVLPADIGLFIDLKNLRIQCSISHEFLKPSEIRVVRSANAFGPLEYLAPSCLL